ncbi:hypothetical protein [Exiguobacterium sp. USCH10]|uniref:hypothetical protein n=1 Tax=Exiguobacterium sp. USCH10 TaxID=3024839 RepID=UPI0030B767C9
MNEQEYMDYLEERFLQLAEENGIQYEKVAPGEGKVIIKENDVIIGELGDPYPTERVLKMLVKEPEDPILYKKIEYSQFFSFADSELLFSEDGYIIESNYSLNNSNLNFEDLLKEIEIKKLVIKGTPKAETPLVTIPNERVSYDACSSQTLMEAS